MHSSYYLTGEIEGKIYLVYNKNNIPYVLSDTSDGLVFDPRMTNPLELTISLSNNGMFIELESGHLGSINNIATNVTNRELLLENSPNVNSDNSILSGVCYTISNSNGLLLSFQIYEPDLNTLVDGIATEILKIGNDPIINLITNCIRFLPLTYYIQGSCLSIDNTDMKSEKSWVTEIGTPILGFTNIDECKVGIKYKYCGRNIGCNLLCKGPCKNNTLCFYNNKVDGYSCKSKDKGNDGKTIIIIILIILLVVSFVFLVIRRV
ncbi:MAG: hypothetical protein COA94_02785 [Rickettsiales bacterium]|nr:MAG: hypothetical protein COA94_02785 [Rickettsiales bacterium]